MDVSSAVMAADPAIPGGITAGHIETHAPDPREEVWASLCFHGCSMMRLFGRSRTGYQRRIAATASTQRSIRKEQRSECIVQRVRKEPRRLMWLYLWLGAV